MGVLPPPIEPTRAPANLSLPAFSLFYDRPSRISLTRWSSDNCTRRCRWSRRALSVYTAITDLFQPDSFFSTFFHRDFPPISGKKVERVISFQDGTKRRRCYFYSSVRSIRNSLAHRVYTSVYIPRRVYRYCVSRFVSRIAIMREHDEELAARCFVRNRCISRRKSTTLTWVNKLLVFEFFSRSGRSHVLRYTYCSKTHGRHGTRRIVRIHMRNRQ